MSSVTPPPSQWPAYSFFVDDNADAGSIGPLGVPLLPLPPLHAKVAPSTTASARTTERTSRTNGFTIRAMVRCGAIKAIGVANYRFTQMIWFPFAMNVVIVPLGVFGAIWFMPDRMSSRL